MRRITVDEERCIGLRSTVDVRWCGCLYKTRADVTAVDCRGRTALMRKIEGNRLAVVKLLLECRVDVELKTRGRSSALHLATYFGDQELVHLLLDRGASVEAKTQAQFTALHIATLLGQEVLVRLLLERDAKISPKSRWCGAEDHCHAICGDANVDNNSEVHRDVKPLSKNLQN